MTSHKINQAIEANLKKPIKIMAHMVAGYPDLKTNLKLATLMETHGVDFIEVQFPFSDPLADGPIIMQANHQALLKGMTLQKSLDLIRTLTQNTSLPIIVMTYYNIPYKFGLERFLEQISQAGASGIILPDIPYDEKREIYYTQIKKFPLHPIFVISPEISNMRLRAIAKQASGFVYTTLRIGTTGTQKNLSPEGLAQFTRLKKFINQPIAAGFGISKAEHLLALKSHCEIAVIGSKIIQLLNEKGLDGVKTFLKNCQTALQKSS